ncbi:hypothetical protein Zmor_008278 [Zophobas morio]|uniref:Odorant receptor n=1 Tax=Zophobas morio TaxID=2755281 RepID=A0AA38IW66_9CUCU|nr:hypothetical protein Zmor_008278 [Zophobas morio]
MQFTSGKPVFDNLALKISRLVAIKVLQNRYLQNFLLTYSIVLSLYVLFQTYLFLHEFDLNYLLKYGASYFMAFYLLLCLVCIPFTRKIIKMIEEKVQPKNLDQVLSRQAEARIKRETVYFLCYMFIHLASVLIITVEFILPCENDEDFMFVFHIFRKYFPVWKSVLSIVCRPAFLVGCITGVFPIYNIIYGYLSVKFVFEAVRDQIENIHNGYEKRQHLRFDEAFHKTVKDRLLRCFKQYIHISVLGREVEKRNQNFLFPFKIGGIFMMISIVLYAFSLENFWTNPQLNRLCSLAICSFLTLAGLAAVGQATEDLVS